MSLQTFLYPETFVLENGQTLPELQIAYQTFGKLNADASNVIWVCHALTANSNVLDWWEDLFGTDGAYPLHNYFIICANNLGSCYGSTGPLSINPNNQQPWFSYFPQITIKDMVAAFELLRAHLGLKSIHTLIGASQGGQIALEWSLIAPDVPRHLVLIATNARHSAWGIAFNESQRLAIKADRTYYANVPDGGAKGLAAARSIALLSYRGYWSYNETQSDQVSDKLFDYAASSYQRYQGAKLVGRFNAYSYHRLLEAMDSHDVGRGRFETNENVLKTIRAKTLVMSISTDLLFPPQEQKFLAEHIPAAEHTIIASHFGHDAFLIETVELSKRIKSFYAETQSLATKHRNKRFITNAI